MALVQWDDSMATGIASIDRQHQQLFRIINSMHTKLLQGRDESACIEVLDSLQSYVKYHFSHEEKLMRQCGFTRLNEHIDSHEEFAEKFAVMRSEETRDYHARTREIQEYLLQWLAGHIQGEDQLYASCMQEAGLG